MLRIFFPALLMTGLAALPATAQDRAISGELTYPERIAVPDGAEMVVELRLPDGTLAGETRSDTAGAQVPLPFSVTGTDGQDYALRAALIAGGRVVWLSDAVVIPDGTGPLALGTLNLVQIEPQGLASALRCGPTEVAATFTDTGMQMRLRGETFDLVPDPAASGARYIVAGDPTTYFWGKGNTALVALRGEELPGCVAAAEPAPVAFRATGNEPGWSLSVLQRNVTYLGNYGGTRISGRQSAPEPTDAGTRYTVDGSDLSYTIRRAVCRDDATGMPRPATVTVQTAGIVLTGCGGDPLSLISGAEWLVTGIGGTALPGESGVTFAVTTDGAVSGSAGCNRYFGTSTLTGEGFSLGQMGSTMMACPDDRMQTERDFLAALATVDMFDLTPDGSLVLTAAGAAVVTAQRGN